MVDSDKFEFRDTITKRSCEDGGYGRKEGVGRRRRRFQFKQITHFLKPPGTMIRERDTMVSKLEGGTGSRKGFFYMCRKGKKEKKKVRS